MIDELLKPPPHAEGPEKSVLSSILQDPETFAAKAKAADLVPSMFYVPAHARLFSLLMDWFDEGTTIELVALTERVMKSGELNALGGPAALTEIYTYAPTSAHWESHVEIIRDKHALRIAQAGARSIESLSQESDEPEDVLNALTEATEKVRDALRPTQQLKNSKAALAEFMNAMQERFESGDMPGAPTGIHPLDMVTGGIRPRELWVVGGETSAGKSVFSLQLASAVLDAGLPVLIFTLELGADEVFARLLSCGHKINLNSIMNPKDCTKGDLIKLKRYAEALGERELAIADKAGMSIDFICAQAESYAERLKPGLIVVDYVQLVEGTRQRGESREQELSRTSRRLKQLAKKTDCPVVTPSQLNDDGKLRESRAIGQDADVILKIRDNGISVDKNRNGKRDVLLPLFLNGPMQRFDHQTNREE